MLRCDCAVVLKPVNPGGEVPSQRRSLVKSAALTMQSLHVGTRRRNATPSEA